MNTQDTILNALLAVAIIFVLIVGVTSCVHLATANDTAPQIHNNCMNNVYVECIDEVPNLQNLSSDEFIDQVMKCGDVASKACDHLNNDQYKGETI